MVRNNHNVSTVCSDFMYVRSRLTGRHSGGWIFVTFLSKTAKHCSRSFFTDCEDFFTFPRLRILWSWMHKTVYKRMSSWVLGNYDSHLSLPLDEMTNGMTGTGPE